MDPLLELARELLSKVDSFVNSSTHQTDTERFQLREDIRAKARQITYTVDGPEEAVKTIARGYTTCTALKVCLDLNLAERLDPADACSIEELAESAACDTRILRPILRLLAQSGIFQQDQEGKWRHTKISVVMTRHSFRAWMKSILEEKYRCVSYLPRLLRDTDYRAPSPEMTAFNAVYSTKLDFYTYSNELDHRRAMNFAISMEELARKQLPFLENAYPLRELDPKSHFIDIAGGLGNLSYFLAERLPEATFEVQDHPFIVEQAQQTCPAAMLGRITFEAQDMFLPQQSVERGLNDSNRPTIVFLLKIILHDHVDSKCKKIIKNLLSVMTRDDRILIIDTVIPEIGGSLSSTNSDLIQLCMFGSRHRTLSEFHALLSECSKDLIIKTFAGGTEEFDGMMVIEVQKMC